MAKMCKLKQTYIQSQLYCRVNQPKVLFGCFFLSLDELEWSIVFFFVSSG